MQLLEVSGAVRPLYGSLGVKELEIKLVYENARYRKLHNNISVVLIVISLCVENSARLNCIEKYVLLQHMCY